MSNHAEAVSMALREAERLTKCKEEMDALLVKYGCMLDVGLLLRPGRHPEPIVKIIINPKILVPGILSGGARNGG